MKRLISMLIIFAMLFSMIPLSALAVSVSPYMVTDTSYSGSFNAGNNLIVTKTVKNNTSESTKASLILGVYTNTGEFRKASVGSQVTISAGAERDITATITMPLSGENFIVKAFVWDGALNATPLTKTDVVNPIHISQIPVKERYGKRPTPNITGVGKTYDDLIFYEREFNEAEDTRTAEEKFNALPSAKATLADFGYFGAGFSTSNNYSQMKYKFDMSYMWDEYSDFSSSITVDVTSVPVEYYAVQQALCDKLNTSEYDDGDNLLLISYVKTLTPATDLDYSVMQFTVQNDGGSNSMEQVVEIRNDGKWHKVYIPFKAKKSYDAEGNETKSQYNNVVGKFGFHKQKIEIAGCKILNYKDTVDLNDLPSTVGDIEYDKRELFDKDQQWRRDAWNRIEQIRKGDIKIIVKDASGNIVPDAEVNIDMYDHEFAFGSNVTRTTGVTTTYANEPYATSLLFNGAVSAVNHKWAKYELDKAKADIEISDSKAIGQKYYRGHTLIVDKWSSYIDANGNYIDNELCPEDMARLVKEGKYDEAMARIKEHIDDQAAAMSGKITDWDVLNEGSLSGSLELRNYFGNSVVKQWFSWAQAADPIGKMYINEAFVYGNPDNGISETYYSLLKDVLSGDDPAQIDGIGFQTHIDKFVSPQAFYSEMMRFASFGKEMKITEFDTTKAMRLEDEEAEASLMRDIMLLAFSIENFNGFYVWGHNDSRHWLGNSAIFAPDFTLHLGGEQYIDLVYNKWWTQEDGVTNANGEYTTRGYYGDYIITAKKGNQVGKVDTKCYKGNDNTIVIVIGDPPKSLRPLEGANIGSVKLKDLSN